MVAKLCLKARPTAKQLADRLRPVDGVWPDGLELYLAAEDLATPEAMAGVVARIQSYELPADFALLIEGPVDSLDGCDFDVTRCSEADREVIKRLAELARLLSAKAVNIHLIAPSEQTSRLTLEYRERLLRQAVPFMQQFVAQVHTAGARATVENMPPVLRMRRSAFAYTPIGMASDDLRWMCQQVPGLEVLVDTSHAGLFLNAKRLAEGALLEFVRQLPEEADGVLGYAQSLAEHLENAQISDAAGLLGEGLPYGEGELELDPIIGWLKVSSQHIVTETIEVNHDEAVTMRDALRRMRAVPA
jgi:hypothetical protein